MTKLEDQEFQGRIGRIETLIGKLETFSDPAARSVAEELVQAILDLHGAGLEQMLELAWQQGEAGEAVVGDFARDDLVRSLLLLHGLHPLDLETRVTQALDKVRPYLGSHGGNVELLGIDDGVVRLQLQGSCDGCPSSAMTLKLAIEEAIYEFAPDIAGMEVAGVVEERKPLPLPSNFIPLTQVRGVGGGSLASTPIPVAPPPTTGRWETVGGALSSLKEGAVRVIEVSGLPVLFCKANETPYAYGNTCPHCGQLLGQAKLAGITLTCLTCGYSYDIMRAGRCLDQPDLHLEPFPLLVERDQVKIALPDFVRTEE